MVALLSASMNINCSSLGLPLLFWYVCCVFHVCCCFINNINNLDSIWGALAEKKLAIHIFLLVFLRYLGPIILTIKTEQ